MATNIYDVKTKELKRRAIYISSKTENGGLGVDELCRKMVKEAAEGRPVKSDWAGKEFVIDSFMPLKQALQSWERQAFKPMVQERIDNNRSAEEKGIIDALEMSSKCTRIENTSRSFIDSALTEALIRNFPEHSDKPTMLQLMSAGFRSSDVESACKIEKLMDARLKEYISGKDTFPPTLHNIIALQDIYETASARKLENPELLKKRIEKTEVLVLETLAPEILTSLSDKELSEGMKIAKKHDKENVNFSNIFLGELKSRLYQGRTFDPR